MIRRCPDSRSTACVSSISPRWCPGRTARCSSPTSAPTWSRSKRRRATSRAISDHASTRAWRAVFLSCNRGKRSVVLDLQTAPGRAQLRELADRADVVVHNMRRDAAVRCGADPDSLTAGHPELVHCAIVGFGEDGPYADLPAYDDTVQAVSGIAGAQAWMTGEPTYAANAMADKVAGLTAAFAIAAALRKREIDGTGAVIEVPMAELLASFGLVEHLWGRTFVPPRGEARYPRISSPERRPFPTADGHLAVVVYTDRDWARFFAMIGRPELADDPRYATLHASHRTPRGALRPGRRAPRRRHDRGLVRAASPRRGSRRCPTTGSTTCSTIRTSSRSGCSRRSSTRRRAPSCSAPRR